MNTNNLTLAVQKDGRLTESTLSFLRAAGLEFENSSRRLFSACRNFPMTILFVRDDDIPGYIESGTVDLGILGQNVLNEERPRVKKLLNLRFGFCALSVSVPKESDIQYPKDLSGKTIATSYPRSAKQFFDERGIPINTVTIRGSVEIAPTLGIASAIVDLVSTGSTLTLNDMRELTVIYRSEAVLIANIASTALPQKKQQLSELLTRCKAVLSAKDYKCVTFNLPTNTVPKLSKLVPGLRETGKATDSDSKTVTGVIRENMFWALLPRLQSLGARNFSMLPVEKIIP